MKTLKYSFLMLAAISLISACNKKLDVLPQQNITPDQIKTAEDVKALLFGEYSLLQNANGYGEQLKFIPDLLAAEDQVDFVGTFSQYKDIYNKEQVSTNSIPRDIWSNSYQVINLSNTVLNKIDIIDDAEKDQVTGEAKLFRGIMLFELVNLFAQPYSAGNVSSNPGVPIVLDAPKYVYDSTSAFVSRASVQAVYEQIIADLTDASDKLPETAENARVTKYTALAYLSRVYMQQHDYAKAATAANDVIQSGNYALVSTYNQAFNNVGNSTEDIFGIQQTAQSNAGTTNNGLTTFYSAYPTGRGDVQVNEGYFSYFDSGDFRGNYVYEGTSIAQYSGYYTGKYEKLYKTIPVVRLAEMYLTRGEANLREGGTPLGGVDPLDDINIIRERAGASPLSAVTTTDFVDERFRELGFEADRLYTLKRLQMNVDGLPYNDPILVLPIPQREIDVNKNLEQNPGY
jgi:hypothetical protein